MSGYFYVSLSQFGSGSHCLNFDRFCYTAPLNFDRFRDTAPLNFDRFRDTPTLNFDRFRDTATLNFDRFRDTAPLNFDRFRHTAPSNFDRFRHTAPLNFNRFRYTAPSNFDRFRYTAPSNFDRFRYTAPSNFDRFRDTQLLKNNRLRNEGKIVYLSGDWYSCGRKLLLANAEMTKHRTSKLRQTYFNRGTLFKTHCAKIKAQFLLCYSNNFLTEAIRRSCEFIFRDDFLYLHVSLDYERLLFFFDASGSSEAARNEKRGQKLSLLRLTPLFLASRGLTAPKSRGARDTALKEKLLCRTGVIFAFFRLEQSGREARNTRSTLCVSRAPRPLRARLKNAKQKCYKLRKIMRLILV